MSDDYMGQSLVDVLRYQADAAILKDVRSLRDAADEIERLRGLHASVCAELFRVDAENVALRPLLEGGAVTDDHEDCAECLRHELDEARSDIQAYRGALGYPVSGDHDGRLTDGTTPVCGLCAARDRRCGSCADWLVQNVWTLQNVPTPVGGLCKSETSHCAAALDGSEWPMEWPADHACPSWRAKDA